MENNLKSCIDDFFDDLILYDDYYNKHNYKSILKANIDLFLENKSDYLAFEIYETFLMIYQITSKDKSDSDNEEVVLNESNVPLDFARIMFKYEKINNEKHQNAFVNSVNVFILGLAIYSRNSRYKHFFADYVLHSPYEKYYKIDGKFSHEEFLYRWGIASLFHDIASPIEFMGKSMKELLTREINSILNNKGETITINLGDLEELNNIPKIASGFTYNYTKTYLETKFLKLFKPTDLLSHRIYLDFGLDKKQLNLLNNLIYRKFIVGDCPGMDNEIKDYGLISSMIILRLYGYIIQNCNKTPDFYFYAIADSSVAILLHNFFKNELLKEPFSLEQLDPSQNPISYLLILCDELQKGNFDDFNVFIDDEGLDVEYVLKSGSLGFGFSEDKEILLERILSLPSIFGRDLWIRTHVENENYILRKMIRAETRLTRPLLSNVEKLAVQMHQRYVDIVMKSYKDAEARGELTDYIKSQYENLCEFSELPPEQKMANIRQVRSIPKKLNLVGYELANLSDERDAVTEFFEDEVIDLAMYEHEEWCEEKIDQGWRYGKRKDNENLVTPYLVPWEDLDSMIQQYDIDPVYNILPLVDSVGLKIVRSKIRLLAFELFKFRGGFDNEMHFEDLPYDIKNKNYIQTNNKVKLLIELGYDIVDVAMPERAIAKFDEHSIEYLAKREHEEWCKLHFNLGWKYGAEKDSNLKTSPLLVEWDYLDFDAKEFNREEWIHLPRICDEVGLKIVRNY